MMLALSLMIYTFVAFQVNTFFQARLDKFKPKKAVYTEKKAFPDFRFKLGLLY